MHDRFALSVAFVPGVTLTKWTRIWAERHPETPLILLPIDQPQQITVVLEGTAQISFVRLPIDEEGLHVIPLYHERAVAVAAKDHFIAAADVITLSDLAGETLHNGGTIHADRGAFDLVAAGVGVLVVPQSIARAQSRKDVVVRPIADAAETQIALVWRADADSNPDADPKPDADSSATADPDAAARAELIADFIGIVRGRTAQSSRSSVPIDGSTVREKSAAAKAPAKATAKAPAKGSAKGAAKGAAKAGAASQRNGAIHAANRKRAEHRKKNRGR